MLRRYLVDHAPGSKVDLVKVVDRLSRAEELAYLPKKPRRGWGSELQFIGDLRREMTPYFRDQAYVRSNLRRYFTKDSFSRAEYLDTGQLIMSGYWDERRPYRLPSPGSLVIACSDMGIGGAEDVRKFWLDLGQRLLDHRCRPIALLPTSSIADDPELKRVWSLLAWDCKSHPSSPDEQAEQLEHLKVLLSPAVRIDPSFLREVRSLIGADASIESRFLQCPELKSSCCVAASFEAEEARQLRVRFEDKDAAMRRTVLESLRYWRGHLAPEVYYAELLFLSPENQQLLSKPEEVDSAKDFFLQLGKRVDQGEVIDGFGGWFRSLRARIPARIWNDPALKPVFQKLWSVAYRSEPNSEPPVAYDPAHAPVDLERPVQTWQLYQQGLNIAFHSRDLTTTDTPNQGSWLGEIRSRSGEIALQPIDPFWQSGQPPSWADVWGEDECGRWVDFCLKGESGAVRQRMRWMPAGAFMMGSSDDDADGFGDERPQHAVIMANGFWMFDTAVTQALWLAVMGENPSHFKGDDLPVEHVSWHDCLKFVEEINRQFTGLNLSLPSEAQWEYGCRAGTETAYSFGAAINAELANYDGKVGQTVEVKKY